MFLRNLGEGVAVAFNTLAAAADEGVAVAARLPLIFVLLHFCYGAGFIAGMLSPRYTSASGTPEEIHLRRVKLFGSEW